MNKGEIMKKILIVFILLICSYSYAQEYVIPDQIQPTLNRHRIESVFFNNLTKIAQINIQLGYDDNGVFVQTDNIFLVFEGKEFNQFVTASKIDATAVKNAVKAKLGIQ